MKYINLFNSLAIIFSLLISTGLLVNNALGVNDDFCYIKKLSNDNENNNYYSTFDDYEIYATIVYCIRGINFLVSLFLFIKILNYIIKEKVFSVSFVFKKLSILIVQLIKLFVILLYRITNFFFENFNEHLRKIYNILSTMDGLLMPLAYILSNDIICGSSYKASDTERDVDDKEDKDYKTPEYPILPDDDGREKEKESALPSAPQSNFVVNPLINNTNNFDLSYESYSFNK